MNALVKYTLARILLFVACFAVAWIVLGLFFQRDSAMTLLAAIIGLVVSAVLALVGLRGLRDQVALGVQRRADDRIRRARESRDADDVD